MVARLMWKSLMRNRLWRWELRPNRFAGELRQRCARREQVPQIEGRSGGLQDTAAARGCAECTAMIIACSGGAGVGEVADRNATLGPRVIGGMI